MLKTKLFAVAILGSCALQASANDISAALANICNIVVADDKSELRKKMKIVRSDFQMKLQDYYDGVSCNGNSLIRTAVLNNAVEAGTLLVKKIPRKHLSAPAKDGKTLQAWIDENGMTDNPIAAELSERI